jgi:hypothetical protein
MSDTTSGRYEEKPINDAVMLLPLVDLYSGIVRKMLRVRWCVCVCGGACVCVCVRVRVARHAGGSGRGDTYAAALSTWKTCTVPDSEEAARREESREKAMLKIRAG